MAGTGMNPAKILFRSPKGPDDGSESSGCTSSCGFPGISSVADDSTTKSSAVDLLTLKLQIEHDTLARRAAIQQELHDQRLTTIKKLLQDFGEDDWQYPDIEKLLGLK